MSQMSVLQTSQQISYVHPFHPKFPRILQSRLNCTPWLRTSYLRDTCEGYRSETWGSGLQTVKNAYFGPGMEMQWLVTLVCVTHYWITDHCCGNVPRLGHFDPFWFADSCCATDSSFPGLLHFYFSLHLSYLCSSKSSSTNTKKHI